MRSVFVAFLLLSGSLLSAAQPPAAMSSAEIYQALKKLNVLGSVLYIAAHPDDENTRLLAYLAKEKMYRTGYLSLTRGDGGQNLIGDEQGVALGLIRTQELLAARRIDGAEQFFTRAYDFGYSKTADETLRIWGHEKILSDVVWAIRRFQPDVIITRFPADSRAGHGHHWASAILANEAFIAAADANRFPEQFRHGVQPWQAKRILWNSYNWSNTTPPDGAFRMDVGSFNSVLGKGYGELASESRSNHKSQGFGAARTRGEAFEYFITTGGPAPVHDLMDGVQTGWKRVAADEIAKDIQSIIDTYQLSSPAGSLEQLVKLYSKIQQMPNSYWQQLKLYEVQQLIEAVSGIFADATASAASAVRGDTLRLSLLINKRIDVPAVLKGWSVELFDTATTLPLTTNKNWSFQQRLLVTSNKALSQPYWLQHGLPNGSFEVNNQLLIGKAENDPAFVVKFRMTIGGADFVIVRPVQYKFTDPVKGELYQPVVVLPRFESNFTQPVFTSRNGKSIPAAIQLKSNLGSELNDANIQAVTGGAWRLASSNNMISSKHLSSFEVSPTQPGNHSGNISLISQSDSVFTGSLAQISYDHIPVITYFTPATAVLTHLDIKTAGRRIGYIPGAGDKIPQALEQMGYQVVTLTPESITRSGLRNLDAIITGIRAYNVHSHLSEKYEVLMEFVQNGGNLIIQYNTNNQIGPVRARMAPYPFSISRTRVSEEDATVRFALPNHPVFHHPNKISAKDFEGWVQERSVYQAEQWHPSYVAPIEMNDTNEPSSNGSLIIAAHGKGNIVYTGLSFFRQLPAGVPGAYRLLANLIALPKNN